MRPLHSHHRAGVSSNRCANSRRAACQFAIALALLLAAQTSAQPITLDDGRDPAAWKVIASDGVDAKLVRDDAAGALRLDFHFRGGSGFCVLRRPVALDLPQNYVFSARLKADAQPNNLEFKLIDPADENVWWINQRAYEFNKEWQTLTWRARRFQFAWGPSGGKVLNKLGAVEIAIAAATGGNGSIWVDGLRFEALPPPEPVTHAPLVRFSSAADSAARGPIELSDKGTITWRAATDDHAPTIDIDFQQVRDLGGVMLDWLGSSPDEYEIELSFDQKSWTLGAKVRDSAGGRDFVPIRDGQARYVRVRVAAAKDVGLRGLRILPLEVGDSDNALYAAIAQSSPRGRYPRYFLGEQQPWTVVGVAADDKEALLDAGGALEVDKGAFRVEPLLFVDGQLITWADVETTHTLAENYLPIPSVAWKTKPGVDLCTTALAAGEAAKSAAYVRYTLENRGTASKSGRLYLALRPFQVLPPWHELNMTGGVAPLDAIAREGATIRANRDQRVHAWSPPDGFGATQNAQNDIVDYLARDELPQSTTVTSNDRRTSAAMRFDFALAAGETRSFYICVPFYGEAAPDDAKTTGDAAVAFDRRLREMSDFWREQVNRVKLHLPPAADQLVNTFRSQQAYIRINADGPRIQPGSRTYERSWMRDGALTSTALLYSGESDAVRAFINWYAPFLFESGKVPCVVDRRGADPVPENDSHGQFIYLIRTYYAFTGDIMLLHRQFPAVERAARYIQQLHAQRRTAEFADGPPEKKVLFGLVPESISHEGYSAKPMHSYWDDFFAVRGLDDAAAIAEAVGRADLQEEWRDAAGAARTALYDSMRLAMKMRGVDYIPGCAELGDFDATSTAIGLYPCGETLNIPQPALGNTFDQYYKFFCQRRDGQRDWKDYTPYEVRLIGSFVRLGQPARAHELAQFFFRDQRPTGWNQWAEVVWHDPLTPRFVGDMPHTWVGSDYISAVRSMFVYEQPGGRSVVLGSKRTEGGAAPSAERAPAEISLIIGAGVPLEWARAPGGVAIEDFPTMVGALSYKLSVADDVLTIEIPSTLEPPGGIHIRPPFPARFAGPGDLPGTGEYVLTRAPATLKVPLEK